MAAVFAQRIAARALRRAPKQSRFCTGTSAEGEAASRGRMLARAAVGAAAVGVVGYGLREYWVQVPEPQGLAKPEEEQPAEHFHSAFVFIMPYAVTDSVKKLVAERLAAEGIGIVSEGLIAAERIDQEHLIDTEYGAIAARAMTQKPSEMPIQQKTKDEFKKAFGLSWEEALSEGVVYNLVDGAQKLGCSLADVGDKYDSLKEGETLIKFGGGFYCGKVDGVYVINGFYERRRSQFRGAGECIHYYVVEWDPDRLSWADFRVQVLGATNPKIADASSLRHAIYKGWKGLELTSEPNFGNNCLHASGWAPPSVRTSTARP